MKILVTSGSTAGSWKIRGEQLGSAIGATVINNASYEQQEGYDITICVKRPPKQWNPSGIVVWDMVDPWPQPAGNEWDLTQCISFVKHKKQQMRADYCVAATQQMRIDTGAEVTVYHHSRPGSLSCQPEEKLATIGYEGDPRYLGRWHEMLLNICEEHMYDLLINPPALHTCDVVVALRDVPFRGVATGRWKSNVKLANAQACGVPFIGLRDAGYTETASGAETFITSFDQLELAIESLKPLSVRRFKQNLMLQKAQEYSLTAVAAEYKAWLEDL